MKRLALVFALLAAAPASGAELMVVGRSGTLLEPRSFSASKGARVKIDDRRCKVGAGTALAALLRTSLALEVADYGSCGRRAADAGGLYVASVAGERERGSDGWVYKVDDEAPSVGGGDPAGRLGARARVLWFWCEMEADGCQRTLGVQATTDGDEVVARVSAFDNEGGGEPAAGARVTLAGKSGLTNAQGVVRLPVAAGRVVATKPGLVRSFPERVG